MICIRTGRDVVFLDDDGETELWRVRLPEGGVTMAELEQFMEHIKREAAKQEVGPS